MFKAARMSGWEHFNEVDEANLKDIIDFYWFFDGPKSWFLYIFLFLILKWLYFSDSVLRDVDIK